MSRLVKVGSKIAENAIEKVIISTFSPFITPFGAWLVAKLKVVLIGILLFGFLILGAVLSGGGADYAQKQQANSASSENNNNTGNGGANTQSGVLPTGITYKTLPVPYINQWLNKDGTYAPRNIVSGWEMGWMTCGATSSVMVAAFYNKLSFSDDKSLKEYVYMDKGQNLPNYCGYNGVGGGAFGVTAKGYCNQSSSGGIIEYLNRIGLKGSYIINSFSSITTSIDQGKPIILSISAPLGHILVIKGYTGDGRVIANDPFGDETKSISTYSFSGENAIYDLESGYFTVNSLIQVTQ